MMNNCSAFSDPVRATIRFWARTRFEWGVSDCMLAVGDYVNAVVGGDCARRYRGRYRTARQCMKVSGFHKDPVRPMQACMVEAGLRETSAPNRGDVGVIEILSDKGLVVMGGLCLGKQWAIRAETGVILTIPTRILAAWIVPCPKP
jgi:hypothetical protein